MNNIVVEKSDKTIISIIALLLIVVIGGAVSCYGQAPKDIYEMSIGRQYLTHFNKVVKTEECFSFLSHKGSKYDIVVSSSDMTSIECNELTLILHGDSQKEFSIIGNGQLIKIRTVVGAKASILIGIYLSKDLPK